MRIAKKNKLELVPTWLESKARGEHFLSLPRSNVSLGVFVNDRQRVLDLEWI